MLRHGNCAAAIALCFLVFGPIAGASAQPGHPGRGGAPAMPHPAAAGPHFAAPHIAAPHVAAQAPHFSAPAPRVAVQRFSAPPRSFAASRAPTPRFAAPHHAVPQIARHVPQPQRLATGVSRHASVASTTRGLSRHALPSPTESSKRPSPTESPKRTVLGSKPSAIESKAQPREPTSGAGQTVGLGHQNLNQKNQGALQAERARLEQSRKAPIIRNPVFASLSPRTMGTRFSTFRGRFAQSALAHGHHHRHAGIVLGFVGLLFWPYAYYDFVDYTFAPYAYDTFWPYAFDDVYAGIYGGYAPEYYAPEDAYAYAGSPASARAYARASGETSTRGSTKRFAGDSRICSGQAHGLTDFSIERIAQQISPTRGQEALLDALKTATVKAVDILQAACPADLPSTPTGRLDAMRSRVNAMLRAVQTVRPAIEKLYHSLSDEQRARFNAMDQNEQVVRAKGTTLDRLCKGQGVGQNRLPIDRIERTLHLSPAQNEGLKALDDATTKAAELLAAKCQPAETLTPTGRLAAMEDRLAAMSKALENTQAALTRFYGSLNDEQKAQFDRINARST